MIKYFLSFLLVIYLSSCINADHDRHSESSGNNKPEGKMDIGMDYIDVYKLKIINTGLYGEYEKFISEMGIPDTVTIALKDFTINSKETLDKLIATAKDPEIVTLQYPGIEMWFIYGNSIVPSTIDFRKTDKKVSYGQTIFDTSYSIDQFKKDFPISANPSFRLPASLFEAKTKEIDDNLEHFMLIRKSEEEPDATPMVEFTFKNGQLIFILFANF